MRIRMPHLRQIFSLAVLLLVTLASSMFAPAAGPAQEQYLVYVGTYTDHGSKGIYVYRFDSSTGKMTSLGLATEAAEPSFLAIESGGRFLYAANETAEYHGQPTGAVSAFA